MSQGVVGSDRCTRRCGPCLAQWPLRRTSCTQLPSAASSACMPGVRDSMLPLYSPSQPTRKLLLLPALHRCSGSLDYATPQDQQFQFDYDLSMQNDQRSRSPAASPVRHVMKRPRHAAGAHHAGALRALTPSALTQPPLQLPGVCRVVCLMRWSPTVTTRLRAWWQRRMLPVSLRCASAQRVSAAPSPGGVHPQPALASSQAKEIACSILAAAASCGTGAQLVWAKACIQVLMEWSVCVCGCHVRG